MTEDPLWPRASAWLSSGGRRTGPRLSVLGVPLSRTSISPSGAHTTPAAVRAALRRFATFHAGLDVDLEVLSVTDHGDLDVADATVADHLDRVERALARAGLQLTGEPAGGLTDNGTPSPSRPISDQVSLSAITHSAGAPTDPSDLRPRADLVVLLGGDNAVTRPAMRALLPLATSGLLTLDAHHDVRGFHDGPTNGTPVRGLVEDGLRGDHVVQVGLGQLSNSRAYRDWCEDRGIRLVGVDDARGRVGIAVKEQLDRLAQTCTDLYVDLDVDVVDSAFVPGCPGARPGGLSPYELLEAAVEAGRHPLVRAVDITEVDAAADPQGRTVDLAAMCLLSVAAGLAARARDAERR
ncbi:MAG: Formimidoylglutamase [Frankiales bacterium]|nr:Formimidoylglutamase [Frankiales bacterium]